MYEIEARCPIGNSIYKNIEYVIINSNKSMALLNEKNETFLNNYTDYN